MAKTHKINKKYTHFAVMNSDKKIINGWETVTDIESLKYFAKQDMEDLDIKKGEYKILSKEHLKRKGIDPFNIENWRTTNIKPDPGKSLEDPKTEQKKYFLVNNLDNTNLYFCGYYENKILISPLKSSAFSFKTIDNANDQLKKLPKGFFIVKQGDYFKPILKDPAPVKNGLAVQKAQSPYLENGKTRFNLRNTPGVYLVYQNSKLVYVGFSASDVYKAMYRHFQKWTDKNQQRITFKDLKNISVRMVYTKTGSKARMLEGALILKHKPPLNINQYDGFITDEKEKKVLKDFETSPVYTGTWSDDDPPPF